MKTRKLGCTGLEVSEIGYGAWGIGGAMWAESDDNMSLAALEKAISLGLTFIDTALAYGDGHSERLIAQVLKRHPQVRVATKIPPKNFHWPAQPGVPIEEVFPLDWIMTCTERSLKHLGVEAIDLQQFHVWSHSWLNSDVWKEAVRQLRKQGKIRFFGVSVNNHEPDSVMDLVTTDLIDTIQIIYNIFDQSPGDGLTQICAENEVGVIARCPFDEGSLTGAIKPGVTFPEGDWRNRYFRDDRPQQVWDRVQKLIAVIGDQAVSLPDAALRYCLSDPAVSTVIPGMRRISSVEQNCAASDRGPLPASLLEALRAHRWDRNFYGA
jgi:aryl-alcohol dehydrogenase-like predicted oxidoreductase